MAIFAMFEVFEIKQTKEELGEMLRTVRQQSAKRLRKTSNLGKIPTRGGSSF